ncbi:hypothetical protein L210DRAFT_3453364 [Boletus edulis BED1]|uniref:F-box domain-containing protein n=1 Tax=Boletus edulis BED1 TaxID=1328754 RepID=A0AAD4GB34_BOLED|nr:hypothetical protein L210DRAFT_3453364 [Boletus edulis BED1]
MPGQVHHKDGTLPQENTVGLPGNAPLPSRKRRRDGTEAPKKRRRAEQGLLYQLNLDELYIICAYVYPMDLLNLARTCKSLRGLLMHRSSAYLWKTALRRVEGLPECPADLAESEYTNLVFYARCHGCNKPAKTVLWNIRRRYCPACRVERLFHLRYCDKIISEDSVLPCDRLTVGEDFGLWVDKDQMDLFMYEYRESSNKTQFLDGRRERHRLVSSHARKCESWQQRKGRVNRFDLEVLRKERQTSIFDCLRQRGYEPEIAYFREQLVRKCNKSVSKKYKPLTNSEWDRMWPEWGELMIRLRSQRLEAVVYAPRRRQLVSEYLNYVTHPSPDSPTFDLLPHVADLARFPSFKDIIETQDEIQSNANLFASAFAQLPMLIDEWKQRLNSTIGGLVKIPSCLALNDALADQDTTDLDKLRLACAVFYVGGTGIFRHPEVFSVSMREDVMFSSREMPLNATWVIPGLGFLEEAPYIIHACGLDPSSATVLDMEHRNARLRCLCCDGRTLIMNWRHAMWHARFYHCISIGLASLSESPRWQLISDEYIGEIQAIEQSIQKSFSPDWTRCLLCRPRVGDAMLYSHAVRHLAQWHNLPKDEIEEGVHYKLIGIRDVCVVEMIQGRGQVEFKVLEE